MKTEIKRNLIVVLFGGVLAYALSFASAAFTEPTGGAPTNNIESPITVLEQEQVKNSGLSVGTFLANGIAEFDQQTFFPGLLKGQDAAGADATLKIGGTDAATSNTNYVDATATGNVHTEKTLGSVELVTQDKRKLCADDQGHVVFCPQLAPVALSLENFGVTAQPVQGGTLDTNAVCSANLNMPAPEDIYVDIQYQTNQNGGGTTYQCSVTIPKGQQGGDDYPGREFYGASTYSLVITSSCYQGSSTSNSGTSIIDDSKVSPRC